MIFSRKNKTLATLLALVLGGLGLHRFYLYGWKDSWAWLHFASLPLSVLLLYWLGQPLMFLAAPLVVSFIAGYIETLVIGLTPDEKWDARHNSGSPIQSNSGWPVALLLVLTLAIGSTVLIASLARTFDLLFTGGAYG